MESASIYTEARNEYLKQLSSWIIPPLVEFFRKEYNTIAEKEGRKAMGVFQTFCSEVPKWNQDIINANANTILDTCRCDYVEELMTAVFIAHTKMLTAVRVNSKQKKLQITLPKLDHFLHRVFTECARMFWKAPFLFSDELSMIERQKNILQAETMCTEALSGAIRSLLPVKNILRDYLENDEADEPAEEHKSPSSEVSTSRNLRESYVETNDVSDTESVASTVDDAPVISLDLSESTETLSKKKRKSKAAAATVPHAILEKVDAPPVPAPSVPSEHVVLAADVKPTGISIEKVEPPVSLSVDPAIDVPSVDSVAPSVDSVAPSVPSSDSIPSALPNSSESNGNPPQLVIDTERSVHFTPYDTVFDETTSNISEIRYTPKISVEDKPPSTWGLEDEGPKLTISDAATSSILGDEIIDLEPAAIPAAPVSLTSPSLPASVPAAAADIDAPLASTSDFEELT